MRYTSLACFIIGAILTGTALFGVQETVYWEKHGVLVQGKILKKYIKEECQSGGGGNTSSCLDNFYIAYNYKTQAGNAYKGIDSTNKAYWDTREIAGDVPLLYSSIEPNKSSVSYALYLDTQVSLWLLVLGSGIVLILMSGVLLFFTQKKQNNV